MYDQYWAAGVAPECTIEQMANCSSLRLFYDQITVSLPV